MGADDERLSRREADLVLRRAVDLHQEQAQAVGSAESLALADLQRLAGELGIPPETVARALVQVRTEALARPEHGPTAWDRLFGPSRVVAARSVPGPVHEVTAAIDAMLRAELFRIARNLGDTVVWENPDSLLHRARRLFDVSGRLRLGVARRITVTLLRTEALVQVRLEADLEPRRAGRIRAAGLGFIGWGSVGAIAAAALTFPVAAVPAIAGLAIGGTFAAGARRTYRRDIIGVQAALDRFLDYLERER
jgi:hypothetical protein